MVVWEQLSKKHTAPAWRWVGRGVAYDDLVVWGEPGSQASIWKGTWGAWEQRAFCGESGDLVSWVKIPGS